MSKEEMDKFSKDELLSNFNRLSNSFEAFSSQPIPQRPTETSRIQEPRFGFNCSTASASLCLRDEQVHDGLFSIIVNALNSLFNMKCLDELASSILKAFEALMTEHYHNPSSSRLRSLVPDIKIFFTPLPFCDAFEIYNQKYRISKRHFIPPTFHEIRHIMNIAQIMAVKDKLKLVTFDGDETLYPDTHNFEDDDTANYLTTLMQHGVFVAVVTAAGYGYQAEKYEQRLVGLLNFWKFKRLPSKILQRFFLFGGQCNYLLRCGPDYHLHRIPDTEWQIHQSPLMTGYFEAAEDLHHGKNADVRRLLKIAGDVLEHATEELALRTSVVRKERAVGLVPGGPEGRKRRPTGSGTATLKPEILEEIVFRVRHAIRLADPPISVPYCAFNGGHDVWVDVGNKAEGVRVLQSFLGVEAHQCFHVGDQFSSSGNDLAARDVSPTLWICNPEETKAVLRCLLRLLQHPAIMKPDDVAVDGFDSDMDEDERTTRVSSRRSSA